MLKLKNYCSKLNPFGMIKPAQKGDRRKIQPFKMQTTYQILHSTV